MNTTIAYVKFKLIWPLTFALLACGGTANETGGSGGTAGSGGSGGTAGSGATGGLHTCFVAGTRIATPRGERSIEGLQVGDLVLAYDENQHRVVPRPVVSTMVYADIVPGRFSLTSGRSLGVTANHPFYLPDERRYVRADEVAGDARLLALNEANDVMSAVASGFQAGVDIIPTQVYNIEVAEHHNYFAEGVLVHNKSGGFPADGGSTCPRYENPPVSWTANCDTSLPCLDPNDPALASGSAGFSTGGTGFGDGLSNLGGVGAFGGSSGVGGSGGGPSSGGSAGSSTGGSAGSGTGGTGGSAGISTGGSAGISTGGGAGSSGGSAGSDGGQGGVAGPTVQRQLCSAPADPTASYGLAFDLRSSSASSNFSVVAGNLACSGRELGQIWFSQPSGSSKWRTACTSIAATALGGQVSIVALDPSDQVTNLRLVSSCACDMDLKRLDACIGTYGHAGASNDGCLPK